MKLYITADAVGESSGGGLVTSHELSALTSAGLGQTLVLSRNTLSLPPDPFEQDTVFFNTVTARAVPENFYGKLKLAHCYSGCLSETILELKCMGVKVTYTCAAHDVGISRREHQKLGMPFDYPHLNDENLWQKYLSGYKMADVLICPSTHSAQVMRNYGCRNRIEIIPHGVEIPLGTQPYPQKFTVGYLGAIGPDKGLMYLLMAWRKLNYKDAVLVLAGKHTNTGFMIHMVETFGGGNIELRGWVNSPSDLYDACSLYVQPSCSEGFGCEVLEAMAHGRPVLCSVGAGASDVVPAAWTYEATNVDALAEKIDAARAVVERCVEKEWQQYWVNEATPYNWNNIHNRYKTLWQEVLAQ